MLINAAANCTIPGCIHITGGTEGGHVSHGPNINTVDIGYLPGTIDALEDAGVSQASRYFEFGYTCEKTGGIAVRNCAGASWLHVEISDNYPVN